LLDSFKTNKATLAFLMGVLFFASLSTVLFELALTRVFSIILWYDYAFMAISIAFFGLGIGSLLVHMQKDYGNSLTGKGRMRRWLSMPEMTPEALSKKITEHAIAYAISVPLFIAAVALIPPDTSYIYVFYIISSVPFFFAGSIMALVFYAMPRQINKLYLADLVGASSAALMLDPLMLGLGAESVLLLTSILVAGSAIVGALLLLRSHKKVQHSEAITKKAKISAAGVLAALAILLVISSPAAMAAMQPFAAKSIDQFAKVHPGPNKGLYWMLRNPDFEHLSAQWNSFSRVDVTRQRFVDGVDVDAGTPVRSSHELAHIIIDADAGTPIYGWSGNRADLAWMRDYMDYIPYALTTKTDHALVIGGGGGEDIMMALAGGATKVTAVEINPLIVSAVKRFGGPSNVYDNPNVNLFIDDGRRFISSSSDKYDVITIKLVDSWAAQLAGGYALSENYLYTIEAFQQYYRHLNADGMLVMIRWNFELPRLMPIVAESVAKETGRSMADVSKQIMVVEDRPGLYFGRTQDSQQYYPVLVMVKADPFTDQQINLVKQKAEAGRADVTMLAASMINPPYDKLFSSSSTYANYVASASLANPSIPTDDSPFYFAKEPVPRQMVILLETVLVISAGLTVMLVHHARKTGTRFRHNEPGMTGRTAGFVLFAIFIGLGFMILEITFIQKFLLLLGTPIMALTVILFSILLSSGVGAYISGRAFGDRPHRAVFVSVPILVGMILFYFFFLQGIIQTNITMDLPARAALTFTLLFPAGMMMGFQFPSLIRMAAIPLRAGNVTNKDNTTDSNNTTLLWGINVVASILGTVLAATLAMIIGFNGNLLVGLAMYAGAAASALLSLVSVRRYYANQAVPLRERE
jgi:predicted membrane-bound spermidine synthase